MNQKAAKTLWIFSLTMLIFTFISWKLDALRTPWVSCTKIRGGSVDGISYDRVVPVEAVYENGTSQYIYILETGKGSVFYPVTVRRMEVMVQAKDLENAALQGRYPDVQVVRFTDRPLDGSSVPARVWEEGPSQNTEDRVEILGVPAEAASILQDAGTEWDVAWEKDRLVIHGADRFTAREAQSLLKADYPDVNMLDYSWRTAILRQSGRMWIGAAAVVVVILLCQVAWQRGKREFVMCRDALETQYWRDYLYDAGVRLLAEAIALVIGAFLAVVLLRWLWNVPIELPGGFLPEDSIFQWEHYRQWFSSTFPEGCTSEYGVELAQKLKIGYGLAGAEWAATIVAGYIAWIKFQKN